MDAGECAFLAFDGADEFEGAVHVAGDVDGVADSKGRHGGGVGGGVCCARRAFGSVVCVKMLYVRRRGPHEVVQ